MLVSGACAGPAGSSATDPATTPPPPTADLVVIGTDRLRFEPDAVTAPASEGVTLAFSAEAGVEHDFVVEDAADVGVAEGDDTAHGDQEGDASADGGDLHVAHADPGQTTTATFQINEPGTYAVYCSVPGHRQGGMIATLTLEEGS